MGDHAILDGTKVVEVECDVVMWAHWFKKNINARRLKFTELPNGVNISTVFLGLNHGVIPGKKLWFETMVFNGDNDGDIQRYEAYEQALKGHDKMVAAENSK